MTELRAKKVGHEGAPLLGLFVDDIDRTAGQLGKREIRTHFVGPLRLCIDRVAGIRENQTWSLNFQHCVFVPVIHDRFVRVPDGFSGQQPVNKMRVKCREVVPLGMRIFAMIPLRQQVTGIPFDTPGFFRGHDVFEIAALLIGQRQRAIENKFIDAVGKLQLGFGHDQSAGMMSQQVRRRQIEML